MYHESEPFHFVAGYAERRLNLTLLFGDRWAVQGGGNRASARGYDSKEQQGAGAHCEADASPGCLQQAALDPRRTDAAACNSQGVPPNSCSICSSLHIQQPLDGVRNMLQPAHQDDGWDVFGP
mmetsp:Transcript_64200/g.106737  ORF Transcript_64200/g.106737 Transcript_64200/m.106737 type:complete len:123 (-) Transcript_64200:45-413(-)